MVLVPLLHACDQQPNMSNKWDIQRGSLVDREVSYINATGMKHQAPLDSWPPPSKKDVWCNTVCNITPTPCPSQGVGPLFPNHLTAPGTGHFADQVEQRLGTGQQSSIPL